MLILKTKKMKKIQILFQLILLSGFCQAQYEFKSSAVSYLADTWHLGAEIGLLNDIGIEGEYLWSENYSQAYAAAKHYFKPEDGLDGIYAGVFGSTGDTDPGMGFEFGKKYISARNILFETGLGIGKSFSGDDFIFSYKLHLGFRVNNPK